MSSMPLPGGTTMSVGTIEVVAADHVPRKRATKEKGIWQASQGFPGTATILPVLLSEGHHKRGLPLQRIAQVLATQAFDPALKAKVASMPSVEISGHASGARPIRPRSLSMRCS